MKKKFNLIDALLVLVIIAVVAFVGIKLSDGLNSANELMGISEEVQEKPKKFRYTFHVEEMPDYVKDYIKKGDTVAAFDNNEDIFGTLKDVTYGESEYYGENSDGMVIKSSKEGHSSADFVFEGKGIQTKKGVKLVIGVFSVGHTMTLRVGNAKVYGKISGIEQIK